MLTTRFMSTGVGWLSTVAGLKWNSRTVSMTRASQNLLKDLVTWMFSGWPFSLDGEKEADLGIGGE